ncbi:MAG TPA: hypothetical protein VF545_11360 [Thermoleophilaceae bacterium]|jgi:ABC-type phosphate transport system auxiliary subunit
MERTEWTDARLDDLVEHRIDQRFEQVDKRFDRLEARMDALHAEMRDMRADMAILRRDMFNGLVAMVVAFAGLFGVLFAHTV